MMEDLGTLCLLGILAVVVMALIPRLLGGFGGRNTGSGGIGGIPRGNETPRYDDPDIESRGGFGGSGRRRGGFLSPRVGGGGTRMKPRSYNTPSRSSGRTDSPDVESRGGFGGDKR